MPVASAAYVYNATLCEDGNKLYQPSHREVYGGIQIKTTREILESMSCTMLGSWRVAGKEWLFDHTGPASGELL